ncbi:sensor histidine kinase [Streptomyces sp. NEAU-W12]|uniref:sensor histidine kinase n=1 Tax=Streptomyces sp. NEAU-W12 TaxID=2994668 RepID=UPI00224ACCFC|nr:histidine kinase [Streptomyces sp. NEAU-W12]MCX2923016.1 histidine kinase [Streptomyces sp. NEAU-W12]
MAGRFRTSDNDLPRDDESAEGARPDPEGGQPPAVAARAGRAPGWYHRAGARDLLAPRLAQGISAVVFSGYGIVTLLNVQNEVSGTSALIVCTGAVVVLYAVQLLLISPGTLKWSARRKTLTLGVQAALTLVPVLWVGGVWGSTAGPLTGSILLLLPGRLAWPCYALVPLAILTWSLVEGVTALEAGYYTISTALTGLVIYGLTRLTDLVREVHDTRAEMAMMAVTQERLRFARDLHDLLGYSLSAITLKSELIHRLVPVHPERARDEVASVLGVARQALADVRLVANGYRDMSLEAEAASVAEVMAAADVDVGVDIRCGRLHPLVDTALATALREGVTNILRHSKVESCTVTAAVTGDTVRLDLVNDGVAAPDRFLAQDRGSGLGNLSARLGAIGGKLTAGVVEDGRYRLTAVAPVRPPAGAETDPCPRVDEAADGAADRSGEEDGPAV